MLAHVEAKKVEFIDEENRRVVSGGEEGSEEERRWLMGTRVHWIRRVTSNIP
jgi:hypothetical protein